MGMIKRLKNKKLNPAATIVLGFLSIILIGTFFLCLPISSADGHWFSFVDSLFTSTSSVCVTGLIVVDTSVHFSLFGQIVIMLLRNYLTATGWQYRKVITRKTRRAW